MSSLRWKLVLAFLAVGLTSIALGLAFASLSTSGHFRAFVFDRNLEMMLAGLSAYYRQHGGWEGLDPSVIENPPPGNPQPRLPFRASNLFTVIDQSGRVVLSGPGHWPGEMLPPSALASARPVVLDEVTVGWVLVPPDVFSETRGEALFRSRVNGALVAGGLGAAAVALLLGFFLARSLTRPLRDLRQAAEAIANGRLDRRVTIRSRDELGALADSFNRMSDALEAAQRQRRQMTADIAHELRTPVSVILGHLDAIENGVLPASEDTLRILREEAERLSRLIEDLRTLAHADAGELVLHRSPAQPLELLRRAVASYQAQAQAKRVRLQLTAEEELPVVEVDADRMAQVLGNLLNNALRHTPEGGSVEIGAEAREGAVRLWVQDSGPGIPPEELSLVFQRFYRTDKSRRREDGGSGLGLAIVRSLVEAHGGRVWAESEVGRGARFVVELPCAQSVGAKQAVIAPR